MSKSLKYHLALLVANIAFGANYSFYLSLIDGGVSSDSLYFLRTFSTFIFFFPAMFIFRQWRIEIKDLWRIALVTVLIVVGRLYLMLEAMNYTSPIDGSIIATTGPAIVLILSVIALHKKAGRWQWAGVVLGLAGALMLILSNAHSKSLFSGKIVGNILLLLSIFFSSINTLYIKRLYEKYHPITIMGWAYTLGMFFVIPLFATTFFNNDFHSWSSSIWWSMGYLALIGTVIATALLYYALSGLSASVTTIYTYIQPFVATLMAIYLGQDHLTTIVVAASVLIFVGLFCMERSKIEKDI